jgi:hypothetical protein
MEGIKKFEESLLKKGIALHISNDINNDKKMITPVNSNPKFTPINPSFHKSRICKSKRFNSTNARYKNVVNKMEKDNVSLRQLRKWSQGKQDYSFKLNYLTTQN